MSLIVICAIYFIKLTTTNQRHNKALLYKKIMDFAQASKFNIKNHLEIF
ncbi:hypothetical protein H238_0178 [Klebsiella pneumoniae UHKPC179]|nr:hypothetical protein H237_0166 [Klebsiella pneumoniae UHKPC57]EPO88399.1 hypothetical protein H238_0178 [Klebsiella pneumoniae UHKPC179]QBF20344.1 Hypothetical protein KpB31_1806 [Klebsiella pneumoniae]BBE60603.1 hypothetical protein TRKP064_1509 [Klebsiella pneumoniae]BBE66193.1 hypothetical protein TRKP067_1508 [Klebsiella pneumoniae]